MSNVYTLINMNLYFNKIIKRRASDDSGVRCNMYVFTCIARQMFVQSMDS